MVTTSRTDSIELLKRSLKEWEGLHGKTLSAEAIEAWIRSFKNTPYALLRRALDIVTAKADRMPNPGFLTKAISEARDEVIMGARVPEPTVPHISELPAPVREEMQRLLDETKQKLGIVEHFPGRPKTEEEARIERNRQKEAFAASRDKLTPTGQSVPSVAPAATPTPAAPHTESDSEPEPYEPTDEDIGI